MSEANSARSRLVLCVAGSAHPAGGSLCCRPCAPVATSLPRTGSSGLLPDGLAKLPGRAIAALAGTPGAPRWFGPLSKVVGSARKRNQAGRSGEMTGG